MKNIVAFGNPLLDTIVFIANNQLLSKYELEKDGQKEISSEEMKNLTEDIKNESQDKTYIAGGCSQNSLRVLQWLTKKTQNVAIFGSVGNDSEASILRKLMEMDGVTTNYVTQENFTTGKTISLVNGVNRSLVAHLGAAEILLVRDILNNKTFKNYIKNADYIYIEGYFLTKREDVATYILDYCNDLQNIVIFNISGEYVCDMVPKTLKYFVENSDVVFGNKREFEALRMIWGFSSLDQLLDLLIKNGKNKLKNYGNIIVITDGAKPGCCYYSNGQKYQFKVEEIAKGDIKDTTGAGDAFVGGFLAGMCEEKSIEECTKLACYAASAIIKQTGCSIPNY